MKRRFNTYPINARAEGAIIVVPAGSEILTVTNCIGQFYASVLENVDAYDRDEFEKRSIHGYLDDPTPGKRGLFTAPFTPVPHGDIGRYLSSLQEVGSPRLWHFFDAGVVA